MMLAAVDAGGDRGVGPLAQARRAPRRPRRDSVASCAISREWPRQCISTHGQPASATTLAMCGSARPPETSLTSAAPASSAAAATAARVVSMLIGTPAAASSRMTGTTRAISVSASTRPAPGRVDSPPTSMRSAPSAQHAVRVGDRVGPVGVAAAVGERIGRDVEDAHDNRHAPWSSQQFVRHSSHLSGRRRHARNVPV